MKTTKRSSESATLVAKACANVKGFTEMYRQLKRRMKTSGRSEGTLHNYSRHLAQMTLHFNCVPTDLQDDQIEDYLYLLQQQHNTPSESYFKHTVFGLRFLFRLEGLDHKRVALPAIQRQEKLPVVLSRQEMKVLLKTPSLLKHRTCLDCFSTAGCIKRFLQQLIPYKLGGVRQASLWRARTGD